jgi:Domain of unknown function (DUF4388)
MAKGNAKRFDDVLELARTRRYTGMVAIEHPRDERVEEGEVFFQAGQPIYARVGRLVGQDALNWLLKWRNIYFTMGTDETMQSVATTAGTNGNSTTSNTSPLPKYSPRHGTNTTVPADGRASSLDNTYTPGIEWLVPQKRGIEREVLALPLTRRQRFIYFLVDGKRTVSDLSRCTGKNIQEIELILSELRAQGLVAV